MRKLTHARTWYLLGMLLVLTVTYTSLAPVTDLPSVSFNDKLEHGIAYMVITLWFGGLLARRRYWLLTLSLLALGAAIEIAQGAMQMGRTADVMDWLADAAGVAVGMGACLAGLGQWVSWIERLVRQA
jgi:VanZ family protein